MSFARQLPLPEPGGQRTSVRRVAWPTGRDRQVWTVLSARPHLWATHWCPGLREKGSDTKGRSAPCWEEGCPRCPHPRQYPPQQLLTCSALDPQGCLTVLLLPGHIAQDVVHHPDYAGTWRGALLGLARLTKSPTAGVWLVDLRYADPLDLPMPHDDVAVMEAIWAKYLPQNGQAAKWAPFGDRDPGEEV